MRSEDSDLIGTPAQIFENKKTAYFFEAGNITSAQMVLESILEDHSQNQSIMVENAFTMVNKNFTLETISARFWNHIL